MASVPEPSDSARYIMELIVQQLYRRAGEVVSLRSFIRAFSAPPWRRSDLQVGMNFAAEQGWVEVLEDKVSVRLTDLGFSNFTEGNVNLEDQCNERIILEKADGTRHENVLAMVNSDFILIPNSLLPIETGDTFLRQLPSRVIDRLNISEPGFHAAVHGFPDHYQVKYQRLGRQAPGSVVNNFHGDNARMNWQSVDNSRNLVQHGNDMSVLADELERLRSALSDNASVGEHYTALGTVSAAAAAAKANNQSKVDAALSAMGSGGKWVLDVGKAVGVPVAIAYLKTKLGL